MDILEKVAIRMNLNRARRDRPADWLYPPASESIVRSAAQELGLALPAILRSIYTTIGNGGRWLGPDYGLVGVQGGHTDEGRSLAALYADFKSLVQDAELIAPHPPCKWPEKLLPLCNRGCAMFSCLDCSQPDGPVLLWNPPPLKESDPPISCLEPEAPTLTDWLLSWLEEKRASR